MKTKLQLYAAALMMGMLSVSAPAQAADDISVYADIGAQSQYIWRGAAQSVNNDVAFQGDVGVEHESGLSANIWFSTGVDVGTGKETEFDFTVDYSGEINELGYSVGLIAYQYTDSGLNFNEIYAGISKGIAALTAYYDADNKNLYTELGAGMTVADMFDASASFGVNSPDVGGSTNHITVGASKDFDNINVNATIGKAGSADAEFAVGVNAAF